MTEPTSNSAPLICDECGQPVQVVCVLGDASNEAVQTILLAAHKRFHADDRALAAAQQEAVRRMGEIGPIAAQRCTPDPQPNKENQ